MFIIQLTKLLYILFAFFISCSTEPEGESIESPSIYGNWISTRLEECTDINSDDECASCSEIPMRTTMHGCENENDECAYRYMEIYFSTTDSISLFGIVEYSFDKAKCNDICNDPNITNDCWSEEMQKCYVKTQISTSKFSISDNILCNSIFYNIPCETQQEQCAELNFISNSDLIINTKKYSSCVDQSGCDSGLLTEQACNAVDELYWDSEERCHYITWIKASSNGLEVNHID